MLALKVKPDPPAADDFDAASARWSHEDAKFHALLNEERAIVTAQSLARNPEDAQSDRCEAARKIAGTFYERALRRPEMLARRLEELRYEIDDARPAYMREVDAWNEARRTETRRIAESLVPKHREAVSKIARAIESLSLAISEERGVRAELAQRAPEQQHYLIPSMEPPTGTLAEWNSMLSEWARSARKRGFLK